MPAKSGRLHGALTGSVDSLGMLPDKMPVWEAEPDKMPTWEAELYLTMTLRS